MGPQTTAHRGVGVTWDVMDSWTDRASTCSSSSPSSWLQVEGRVARAISRREMRQQGAVSRATGEMELEEKWGGKRGEMEE